MVSNLTMWVLSILKYIKPYQPMKALPLGYGPSRGPMPIEIYKDIHK